MSKWFLGRFADQILRSAVVYKLTFIEQLDEDPHNIQNIDWLNQNIFVAFYSKLCSLSRIQFLIWEGGEFEDTETNIFIFLLIIIFLWSSAETVMRFLSHELELQMP